MATERVKRKISAILSADVVGYSRLMEDDEAATVRTLESYRETVSSLVLEYNGHVVDSPGDNILAEFPSVVDAVQCAVEIQQVLKTKNADLSTNRKMVFRIGINLGDVIEEGERIYGDGINIAARIEALAKPGGICISGSAYEQIATKLALGYENLGDHALKNISRPIRVYRIPTDPGAAAEAEKKKELAAGLANQGGYPMESAPIPIKVKRKADDPDDYYLTAFICLAIALGLPVLAYFIGRIEPMAFYPIVGAGAMLAIIGLAFLLWGKLLSSRTKGKDENPPEISG